MVDVVGEGHAVTASAAVPSASVWGPTGGEAGSPKQTDRFDGRHHHGIAYGNKSPLPCTVVL